MGVVSPVANFSPLRTSFSEKRPNIGPPQPSGVEDCTEADNQYKDKALFLWELSKIPNYK